MTKRVTIIDVKDYVGQEVTIGLGLPINQEKEKLPFCNCVTEQPFSKV